MENFLVIGPTASGKTAKAIELSRKYKLPIVNFDTVQFKKYIEVISCSPSKEEKNAAPHYLFNFLEPHEKPSLGDWMRLTENFGPHIAVGGSIFYALNILRGVPEIIVPQEVKNFIENLENPYQYLKSLEPETKIHINDKYRINRRLEILLTPHQPGKPRPYNVIKMNPENLMEKIQKRTHLIWEEAIAEAENHGYFPQYSKIIGYQQIWDHISGKINKEEAIKEITKITQKYAKKQIAFMNLFVT